MDRQKAAQVTVRFWQGLAGALAGIVAAIVTAFLAAAFHQFIIVGAVVAAGVVLYRCRKLRRQGQLIASPM